MEQLPGNNSVSDPDEEIILASGPDGALPSDDTQSSSQDYPLVEESVMMSGSAADEDNLNACFSDPSQDMDQQPKLMDQILFLMENSTDVDKTLNQTTQLAMREMEKEKDELIQQETLLRDMIAKEKRRAAIFRRNVVLCNSLETNEMDQLLNDYGKKVAEVHSCCVKGDSFHLSTLEKMRGIERHLSTIFQAFDEMPKDVFEHMKDRLNVLKNSRLREDKQQLEKEKEADLRKKCIKRAMAEVKINRGKKLVPRTVVWKPAKEIPVLEEPDESDTLADLFTDDFS